MRFKLELEYDGTPYSGWQIQKHNRTVQGDLLQAVQQVFSSPQVELYGAGRTDAGVHALHQVAHLDVQTQLTTDQIKWKLNEELPSSLNVLSVAKASPKFHARHDAVMRSYIYQISRRRSAFGKKYMWWVRDYLDINAMRNAAKALEGFHDFQSFADDSPEDKSTTVQLQWVDIYEEGDMVIIRVVGSHFLWKMVRRIVGVLVEVGRKKLALGDVYRFLEEPTREPAKFTAPPAGLFLERVYYKNDQVNRSLEQFMAI